MRTVGVFVIATLIAGCEDEEIPTLDDDGTGGEGGGSGDTVVELRGQLVATDPAARLNGDAIVQLLDRGRAFSATILLRDDVPGSVRAWHVHVGPCGYGGAIVGPATAYAPLKVDSDGGSMDQTLVLVPLDTGAYSVNVHDSPEHLEQILACGDLIRQ
jgi:hypothetical protein